jgi:hypothetical protein
MTVEGEAIGDYRIVRELSAGKSWLAQDSGGRSVVLKMLPGDCLVKGQLRGSIRERLARFREAAHAGLGNLLGVEREGEVAFMVWEYVEGQTLEEALKERRRLEDANALGRDVIRMVEGLHALGLVHGAIHGRNVIVASQGLRLVDASPLLYTDPQDDVAAVGEMLGLPAGKGEGETTLRGLAEALGSKVKVEDEVLPAQGEGARFRREAVAAAVMALIVGIGVAVLIYWWVSKGPAAL